MRPLKILVVEDVILTAINLRRTLEEAGHTVIAIARTLQEARQAVLATPPDLALIDITLQESEGNGIETAKELSSFHLMPFIYLTGNSELSQFQQAQQTQPAAYLLKPFKASELLFNVELAYHNFKSTNEPAPLEGRLMLPTTGGLEMIILNNVMYLKAGGAYAEVIMDNGTRYLVSTGLGHLEHYFNLSSFFRLSRSYVVNLNYIKRLEDNVLLLSDGQTRLTVPDVNRKELLNRLTVVRTKPR